MDGQRSGDLGQVVQIVYDPGSQQLPKCDPPQLRVSTGPGQVLAAELPTSQDLQILASQRGEFFDQINQGATGTVFKLRYPVERVKGTRLTLLEDDPRPRDPIRPFPVNQVSKDIEGSPVPAVSNALGPARRQIHQQGSYDGGCLGQDLYGVIDIELHYRPPNLCGQRRAYRRTN